MTATECATLTYRKTRKGEWVVYGPASAIQAGTEVAVTKASGATKTEYIASTGHPFRAGGTEMVYGYTGERPAQDLSGCAINPKHCRHACTTYAEHSAVQQAIADELNARPRRRSETPLSGRCRTCRCHGEPGAGTPGTILYDGCDYCGCQTA